MSKHLAKEQIAGYLRRQSPISEMGGIEEHIAECPDCRSQIILAWRSEGRPGTDAGLGHLPYEALESYVDGTLSPGEREALLAHSKECQRCGDELKDVQSLHDQLFQPSRSPLPIKRNGGRLARITLTSGGLAALLLLALWVVRSRKQEETSGHQQAQPSPAPFNLGGGEPIADEIASLESKEQKVVLAALQQQSIPFPRVIAALQGQGKGLRGTPEKATLAPLAPVGEVVADVRPLFQWRPLEGAKRYSIVILDSKLQRVEASPALQDTKWRPERPLQRGVIYQWVVEASLDNGATLIAPAPPQAEAMFKVLAQTDADEFNRFRATHANSHLVLGILYVQAGMLTAGEDEWRQISIDSPNYEIAHKLIRGVEEIRRARDSQQ